jgi:ribosomal protein L44E
MTASRGAVGGQTKPIFCGSVGGELKPTEDIVLGLECVEPSCRSKRTPAIRGAVLRQEETDPD